MSGSPCGDETTFREDLELMQMEDTVGKTFENDLNRPMVSVSEKPMQCKSGEPKYVRQIENDLNGL